MNDYTEKHGVIGRIVNRINQFRTTVEENSNSCFNKTMQISEPFATRTVKEKTRFYLRYPDMNSYKIPPCYSKIKYTALSCGIVDG